MTDFWTLFAAVFLGEIASLPVKKYFTPRYEKALEKIEQIITKSKTQ